MRYPAPPPDVPYLRFVRDQARVLARRAQRSGLHERARHFRMMQDWAEGHLQKIFGAFQDYLNAARGV